MYVVKGEATMTSQYAFVGTYEARSFPKGWAHPKRNGRYVPLLPYGYAGDETDDFVATPETTMPPSRLQGENEIAAYEAVSEGTPISPAFPDTPQGRLDLCNWCAANEDILGKRKVDAEAWAAILFGDAAITGDGSVIAQ